VRDPRLVAAPVRVPHLRRLPLLIALLVGVALILPPVAASAAGRSPAPDSSAGSSAILPCTRTVSGFSAAAVHQARDLAGVYGIVCFPAGTFSGTLNASVTGQTWRLSAGTTFTGVVQITGFKVTLTGGTISRPASDRWEASVQVRAHDVTVTGVAFRGGGTGVNVYGRDRARIISNSFRYQTGSAISIWSEGVGAERTLVWGNLIVQTNTYKVSPITSRGNDGNNHSGVQNWGTIIRKNTINQGQGDLGWFGIELKQSKAAIVESNTLYGGHVLVSIPETDNALIRYNVFDLRGKPDWGVEVGNAYDAVIDGNTFIGDGPGGNDYAISLNTGSLRTYARVNRATSIRTFFAIAGNGHRVNDNCLNNVRFVQEFAPNGGSDIIFARNGPC